MTRASLALSLLATLTPLALGACGPGDLEVSAGVETCEDLGEDLGETGEGETGETGEDLGDGDATGDGDGDHPSDGEDQGDGDGDGDPCPECSVCEVGEVGCECIVTGGPIDLCNAFEVGCIDGVCTPCQQGYLGCDCREDDSCDVGLECDPLVNVCREV
jgi:hypothetical protein